MIKREEEETDRHEFLLLENITSKTLHRMRFNSKHESKGPKKKVVDGALELFEPLSTHSKVKMSHDTILQKQYPVVHAPWEIFPSAMIKESLFSSQLEQLYQLVQSRYLDEASVLLQELKSLVNEKYEHCWLLLIEGTISYYSGEFSLAAHKFSQCLLFISENEIDNNLLLQNIKHDSIQGLICSELMNSDYLSSLRNIFKYWSDLPMFFFLDLIAVWICKLSTKRLLIVSLSILFFLTLLLYGRHKIPYGTRKSIQKNLMKSIIPESTNNDPPDSNHIINPSSLDFQSLYNKYGKQAVSKSYRGKTVSEIPSERELDGQRAIFGQRVIIQPYYQHSILDIYKPLYQRQEERVGQTVQQTSS
jgi:hypothetical protein